ncbi:MAG: hypothetical protein NUV97_03750 [archaeon]|nr:hypothetical protein [archaeon]MCR4323868.1 hypothetical protein [Nanoarchaeota archaeon]
MLKKRGQWRGYLLPLILGLIVVALVLYFIFNEYFTSDELNWEQCSQSFTLRATMPESKFIGMNFNSFKNEFPLKCKTQIIEIDDSLLKEENGITKAESIIAETMAQCWNLYGRGDGNAFPSSFLGINSFCVPCARIHFTEEAKKYLKEIEPDSTKGVIDIKRGLETGGADSAFSYLQNSGKKFSAFSPGNALPFEFGKVFRVYEDKLDKEICNRLNGECESGAAFHKTTLPIFFYPDLGDILVSYGVIVSSDDSGPGDYLPYLFYFQIDQKNPNPFSELTKEYLDGPRWHNSDFCEEWDGVPN